MQPIDSIERIDGAARRHSGPSADVADQPAMPKVLDLENSVLVLLTTLSNSISATGLATFRARHGLGSTEWKVLATVAGRPQSSGAQIAQFLSIDRGLVSRTIRALARRDLFRVEKAGRQSNYQAVSLTTGGADIHSEALVTALEREKLILAGMDIVERDAAIGSLKKMLINMEAVAELSRTGAPDSVDLQGLEHLR